MLNWLRTLRSPPPTFALLSEQWLTSAKQRLRWATSAECILHKDILPAIGPMRVDRISRADIARVLHRCEARGSLGVSNLTLSLIRVILNWGHATGRLDLAHDPTRGFKRHRMQPRSRILTEPELAQVWRACEPLSDHGRVVRLLILTGQRREEVGGMRWDELDLEHRTWQLPAARTKNRRPHGVHLSGAAIALLPPRRDTHPHVFGKLPGRGYSGWSKAKRQLDAAMGEHRPAPWTLHDLRRSFVTHMVESGIAPPHIVEAIVNHISGHKGGVAGVYNRAQYASARRDALERWAIRLAALVGS